MTKADLVDKVHENVGFSRNEAAEFVDLALEIIKGTLERGENVKLSGFGSFVVREKRHAEVEILRPARTSKLRRGRS